MVLCVLCPDGPRPSYCDIPLDPACVRALGPVLDRFPTIVPSRVGNVVTLYHGTQPSLVPSILKNGLWRATCKVKSSCQVCCLTFFFCFLSALCRYLYLRPCVIPSSYQRQCECQMLGFGVYFAERDKAKRYAELAKEPVPGTDYFEGAVVECEVSEIDILASCFCVHVPCFFMHFIGTVAYRLTWGTAKLLSECRVPPLIIATRTLWTTWATGTAGRATTPSLCLTRACPPPRHGSGASLTHAASE